MTFSKLDDKQLQKLMDDYVNNLVQSLRVQFFTEKDALFISDSLVGKFRGKPIPVAKLTKSTKNEILGNYKAYTPFCLASIITAFKKITA